MQKFLTLLEKLTNEQIHLVYLAVIVISYLMYLAANKIILKAISRIFKKTSTEIDDILIEKKVFNKIPYLIPLIFIYGMRNFLPLFEAIERVLLFFIALVVLISINAFVNAVNVVYTRSKFASKLNIKSYIQVLKLAINMLGIIVLLALVMGKSPVYLLSGVGALTAVLLLVFKDTILSLVSSIQISSNNLFKVGDWIEAPQFGADGNVVDIALHSVKIQNWDKTISIIPTNKMIESSFKNWKGMSKSGGRRIKRSIKIDMSSIKFCSDDMIEKYREFKLISDYILSKTKEIKNHNQDKNVNETKWINGRYLTNIGTFRAYIESYLRENSNIHQEMTFLVRQLAPGADGLPIEIYVFSNDTNWVNYEAIQADIFDHLLSVLPEFDLKVFQNPTGDDFKEMR